MLQSNYIGFLLNLKEVCVISYSEVSIVLSLPQKYHICPNSSIKQIKFMTTVYKRQSIYSKHKSLYQFFFVNVDMFALIVQSVF